MAAPSLIERCHLTLNSLALASSLKSKNVKAAAAFTNRPHHVHTLSKKVIKRYKVLSKKCSTKSTFQLKNESARFCIKDAHSSVESRLLEDDGQMVEDHKVILAGSGH